MSRLSFFHRRSIFWFLLVGPALGLLAILLAIAIRDPTELQDFSGLAQLPVILIVGLPFAYLIGLIPALIASLLFGAAVSTSAPWLYRRTIPCFLLGTMCGALGCLVLLPILGTGDRFDILFLSWTGGFSGAFCALIVKAHGVRADNSSRPDSLGGSV